LPKSILKKQEKPPCLVYAKQCIFVQALLVGELIQHAFIKKGLCASINPFLCFDFSETILFFIKFKQAKKGFLYLIS